MALPKPDLLVQRNSDNERRWVGKQLPTIPAWFDADEQGRYRLYWVCICGHLEILYVTRKQDLKLGSNAVGVATKNNHCTCDNCGISHDIVLIGNDDNGLDWQRPALHGPDGNWLPHVLDAAIARLEAAMALPDGVSATPNPR